MSDKERAKQVLLEIIRQSTGDEIEGKTKLFKAFYLAHLYYASENAGLLTEWPIVRMPRGPGIHGFDELIGELERDGFVKLEPCKIGPYPSTKYCVTAEGRQAAIPQADVVAAIKKTIELVECHTADRLSELTHEFSKSWNEGKDGDELPIYLDLLDDEQYEQVKERNSRISDRLSNVWV